MARARNDSEAPESLAGNLLIAMPQMEDPRFAGAVIYLCAHNEAGAMGLVVNKALDGINLSQVLEQLNIEGKAADEERPVLFGGPVETTRGFVLHSTDFLREASLVVGEDIAVTSTLEILQAIADGTGPAQSLFALGYAGWGPGQLDQEIQANGWLHAPAAPEIVFARDLTQCWNAAIATLGFSPSMLSGSAGHA
jgi:putative transcriptional regulator